MPLNLMYITNRPEIAQIAEAAGVDRVFVDMEYIGKSLRQGGMDTVQSHHTFEDIKRISECLTESKLLVRVNPMHDATAEYCSSEEEIDSAIANGADILMLPYFKTAYEVQRFVQAVKGRVMTIPLLETPEAVEAIDDILSVEGIDEMFIGLNDLSLGYGKRFMFELLSDGTVEYLVGKCKQRGLRYGFGGLAALNGGLLPGHMVLKEHYRLGSSSVILSRSFCNVNKITNLSDISTLFQTGVAKIRKAEQAMSEATDFEQNKIDVARSIETIKAGLS